MCGVFGVGLLWCFWVVCSVWALKLYVFLSGVCFCCIMFWDDEVVCGLLCESVFRMACM